MQPKQARQGLSRLASYRNGPSVLPTSITVNDAVLEHGNDSHAQEAALHLHLCQCLSLRAVITFLGHWPAVGERVGHRLPAHGIDILSNVPGFSFIGADSRCLPGLHACSSALLLLLPLRFQPQRTSL